MIRLFLQGLRQLRLLVLTAGIAMVGGCLTTPVNDERQQLGVSIMSINLLDILNQPRDSNAGVPWRTRYLRIIRWIAQTGNHPDVIVLQEAPGYWTCLTDPHRLADYEAMAFLLDGIRTATGEQYRIAYLIGGTPHGAGGNDWMGQSPAGGCTGQGDYALLYRPSRIRNVLATVPSGSTPVSEYKWSLNTSFLAKSVQCCSPASSTPGVCTQIDGPPATPVFGEFEVLRGTCSTPLGLAFTRARAPTQGSNLNRPFIDAVFSRLELVGQPGAFVHIYNVHRGWNEQWQAAHGGAPAPATLDTGSQNIKQLVADMEGRYSPSGPLLYPPILVGDFNAGPTEPRPDEPIPLLSSYFMNFDTGYFFGIDGVLFGKRSDFPSSQAAFANLGMSTPVVTNHELCKASPATLVSDHCAIFFRVEPTRR